MLLFLRILLLGTAAGVTASPAVRTALGGAAAAVAAVAAPPPPIAISKANRRYLEFRGATVALLSSGEHYGSLLNAGFNYSLYFNTLQASNFTLTQAFSGSYVEPDDDCNPNGHNPGGNPLSPANGSYLAPWKPSATAGGPKGQNKFDLSQWDPAYFSRLQGFVAAASDRGVVVELVLFCG